MPTIKNYKYIAKEDYSVIFQGLSVIFVGLSFIDFNWNADPVVSFLLSQYFLLSIGVYFLFTSSDVLGFKWAQHWGYTDKKEMILHAEYTSDKDENHQNSMAAYRLNQHIPFIVILLLLILINPRVAVGVFILWWTGVADFGYYPMSNSIFGKTYNWLTTWVWIFPAGLVYKLKGKYIPKWAFFLNVLLGIVSWVLVGIL